MRTGYKIELQKEGRGDAAEFVKCKSANKAPDTDKITGEFKGTITLRARVGGKYDPEKKRTVYPPMPVLKVVLTKEGSTGSFELTWSNAFLRTGADAGKFKLKRVDATPTMIYVKDHNNRVKKDTRGALMPDYVEMAKRWGTHWSPTDGWEYGAEHPQTRTSEECWECESLRGVGEKLAAEFGEELAVEVLTEITNHPMWQASAFPVAA